MAIPKAVHIYLAPYLRNPAFSDSRIVQGDLRRKIRSLESLEGVTSHLLTGNGISGQFDYAIENLTEESARKVVEGVNQLPGYAAKAFDWRP